MATMVLAAEEHIRRETIISVILNMVIGAGAVTLIMGTQGPVPVGGPDGFILDLIPQSFMIALMITLIPGLITERKLAAGKVTHLRGTSRLPRRILPRALLMAVICGGIAGVIALVVGRLAGDTMISWWLAFTIMVSAAALVALIVTPLGLKAGLVRR